MLEAQTQPTQNSRDTEVLLNPSAERYGGKPGTKSCLNVSDLLTVRCRSDRKSGIKSGVHMANLAKVRRKSGKKCGIKSGCCMTDLMKVGRKSGKK